MVLQPALATPNQFLDLLVAHPVVLFIVENRDQHREVPQQIRYPLVALKSHCEIAAHPPIGVRLIEDMPLQTDRIAERFEQLAQDRFAATTGQRGNAYRQRNRRLGAHQPGEWFF